MAESDRPASVGAPNRREFPRFALQVAGSAWCVNRAAGPCPVTTSDISGGGLMLHTSSSDMDRVEIGDELLIGIPEPGGKSQISLRGRMVWKRRGLMTLLGAWSFGVQFHDTEAGEIAKLLGPAERGEPLPEH